MFENILFCTDFSENAQWAFTYAISLAKTFKSKIFILHVIAEPVHPEQLSAFLPPEKLKELKVYWQKEIDRQLEIQYLSKRGRFKSVEVIVKEGEPFVEIIRTARKESASIIVMGTHGRTGLNHVLFGSTAERVVRKSPCPVLTVRLPGKLFRMP